MGISFPSSTAAGHDDPVTGVREVLDGKIVIGVDDHSARGNEDRYVIGIFAVTITALTVRAALGTPMFAMRDRREIIDAFLRYNDDTASIASVAAIRAPARNVLFAPETQAAITAVSAADFNLDSVDEHGGRGRVPAPGF